MVLVLSSIYKLISIARTYNNFKKEKKEAKKQYNHHKLVITMHSKEQTSFVGVTSVKSGMEWATLFVQF